MLRRGIGIAARTELGPERALFHAIAAMCGA
jgi:hypothetical protein